MKTVEKKEQEELFREVTKKTSLVLCRQDKEKTLPNGEGAEVRITPQRHQEQHGARWSQKQIPVKVIPSQDECGSTSNYSRKSFFSIFHV